MNKLLRGKAKWVVPGVALGLSTAVSAGVAFAATPSPAGSGAKASATRSMMSMSPAQANSMMSDMANALPAKDRAGFSKLEAQMLGWMAQAHMFSASGSMMGNGSSGSMASGSMMGNEASGAGTGMG